MTRPPLRPWTLAAAVALSLAAGCHRPSAAEKAAASIVERNAAARGGVAAWRAVRTLSLSGTLEAGVRRDPLKLARAFQETDAQARAQARRALATGRAPAEEQVRLPYVMELARPRRSRVEISFQGQTAVQVYDGSRGWKLRPFLGRREVEPYTAEEARIAAQQSELEGPLLEALERHERIALLATEKVDGRDAYELEVTSASGDVRHVWVDAESSLDVKVDGTRRMDGKLRPVWTVYRDWRREGGVMIPHLLETTVEGVHGAERIVVERVAVNPPLAVDRFARPD